MKVLMVGVDDSGKGGMWSVVKNYLDDPAFCRKANLTYLPVSTTGSAVKRILYTWKALRRVRKELRMQDFEIVHIHMSEKGSVFRKGAVQAMAKRAGCRTILHLHGAMFEDWYRACSPPIQKRIRRILNTADRILLLGEYWRGFIGSLVDDPAKIKVLYNAVECPGNNRYREQGRNLLFLGAVDHRKGIDDLLAAMARIEAQLPPDVRLHIYGPDVRGDIQQRIRNAGLETRVNYCGWLAPEMRETCFQSVMLNLLPSYHEGLPMTILETMAYGIPNISTPVAAIPEVVENGKNGLLIPPGNPEALGQAILTLTTQDSLRMAMSDAAFEEIRCRFTLEQHKNALFSLYRQLAAEPLKQPERKR